MEETKSKMSQPYPVSINRRNEITAVEKYLNLTGIVSENQIWENTSLWPDSVQQWLFCIPSSKFVTLTKFITTGTRNGIYLSRNIRFFECC